MTKKNQYAIIGILFSIIVFFITVNSLKSIHTFFSIESLYTKANLALIAKCVILLTIYLYSQLVEKEKFMLFSEEKKSAKFYILSAILLPIAFLTMAVITSKILSSLGFSLGEDRADVKAFYQQNPIYIWLMAFTAGIGEELVHRGYILSRLTKIFKSSAVAVIISAVLFGLTHYNYGTLVMLINPFWFGLISGIFYLKYKNIKALIIAHTLTDLIALYFS